MADASWREAFNAPMLNWLGLITRKPVTQDYVPLLPWMGVVWLGVRAGQLWLHGTASPMTWQAQGAWAALAWLGRHSPGLLHAAPAGHDRRLVALALAPDMKKRGRAAFYGERERPRLLDLGLSARRFLLECRHLLLLQLLQDLGFDFLRLG